MEPGSQGLALSLPLRAGPFSFRVGSPNPELASLAEGLFRDLIDRSLGEGELPCFLLSRSPSRTPGASYNLTGPVVGSMTGLALSDALTWLVSGISRAALDAEPERLHLHAAGAVRRGGAAILAAARETGKTTTLARLALNGWGFISDETVSISGADDEARGFAKPLSIKPGGRELLPELAEHFLPSEGVTQHAVLHVPLGAVESRSYEACKPHLVGLLRRRTESSSSAGATSKPLHPVDAVVGLMGETLDAGRFGQNAVLELARLAARCRCHEITVGDPDATVVEIERLFDEPPVDPMPIKELRGGTSISPNAVSILVGDRVVIHEQPEGRIFALDTAATQIWLNVGGWAANENIDLGGPVVAPFVKRLADLGLVLPLEQ